MTLRTYKSFAEVATAGYTKNKGGRKMTNQAELRKKIVFLCERCNQEMEYVGIFSDIPVWKCKRCRKFFTIKTKKTKFLS
jgi:transposase-like protein